MKAWLIWVIGLVIFAVFGFLLSLLMGGFGWVIGGFIAVLVIIMMFKAKANAANRDQKVYDEY
ncbi:MAG: hypothetical protein IIU65_02065 [Clostridia bacterium]|nr:hypothetical protein [Clostridia bacterium]